jgi:hypothetical protein
MKRYILIFLPALIITFNLAAQSTFYSDPLGISSLGGSAWFLPELSTEFSFMPASLANLERLQVSTEGEYLFERYDHSARYIYLPRTADAVVSNHYNDSLYRQRKIIDNLITGFLPLYQGIGLAVRIGYTFEEEGHRYLSYYRGPIIGPFPPDFGSQYQVEESQTRSGFCIETALGAVVTDRIRIGVSVRYSDVYFRDYTSTSQFYYIGDLTPETAPVRVGVTANMGFQTENREFYAALSYDKVKQEAIFNPNYFTTLSIPGKERLHMYRVHLLYRNKVSETTTFTFYSILRFQNGTYSHPNFYLSGDAASLKTKRPIEDIRFGYTRMFENSVFTGGISLIDYRFVWSGVAPVSGTHYTEMVHHDHHWYGARAHGGYEQSFFNKSFKLRTGIIYAVILLEEGDEGKPRYINQSVFPSLGFAFLPAEGWNLTIDLTNDNRLSLIQREDLAKSRVFRLGLNYIL